MLGVLKVELIAFLRAEGRCERDGVRMILSVSVRAVRRRRGFWVK